MHYHVKKRRKGRLYVVVKGTDMEMVVRQEWNCCRVEAHVNFCPTHLLQASYHLFCYIKDKGMSAMNICYAQ